VVFSPPPVTSSLLGPNILLNTLFSNTLSLCSFLNVSDQVSHPYKITDKIVALYVLVRILLKPYKNVGHFTWKVGMFQTVDRNTDNALLCLLDNCSNSQYIFDSNIWQQQQKGKALLPFLGNSGYANALQFYVILQCLPCYCELWQ
jgi:hypothetical protein